MEERNSLKTKLINTFIIIIIFIIVVFLYAKYIGAKTIIVKEERLASEKIPSSFSGNKIIYFSDLLYGSSMSNKELTNLVNMINELKPDLVIFGGDLISSDYKISDKEKTRIINNLKNIDTKLGKYFVLSASDNELTKEILEKSEFLFKENESELVYNDGLMPICLSFVGSYKDKYNFDSSYCEDVYNITITHEPDLIDTILENITSDIILSGNTLGGEINLPFIGPLKKFEGSKTYDKEEYNINGTKVFISNGLGTRESYLRLFNRPSFYLFRLKSLEQN